MPIIDDRLHIDLFIFMFLCMNYIFLCMNMNGTYYILTYHICAIFSPRTSLIVYCLVDSFILQCHQSHISVTVMESLVFLGNSSLGIGIGIRCDTKYQY